MFVGMFQNGLKTGHFSESLAQKSASSLEEVVTKVECYIKGEEKNIKRKVHDSEERIPNTERSHPQRKRNYISPIKDKSAFKRVGKVIENFTPLNIFHE